MHDVIAASGERVSDAIHLPGTTYTVVRYNIVANSRRYTALLDTERYL